MTGGRVARMDKHAGTPENSEGSEGLLDDHAKAETPRVARMTSRNDCAVVEVHKDRTEAETPHPAVVGRFAPTPSGRMHLGNAYAMLAAWLSARASGGRIVLRVEDIDAPRVVRDADRWIQDDLAWLGLDWDGEPVYQSDRLDRYEQVLQDLRARGLAYPCFCSRADIRAASAPNEGDGFVRYPGTCRRLWLDNPAEAERRMAAGHRYSWRLAMPPVPLGVPELNASPVPSTQTGSISWKCLSTQAVSLAQAVPPIRPVQDANPISAGQVQVAHAEQPEQSERSERFERSAAGRSTQATQANSPIAPDVCFNDHVFGPQRFNLPHDLGDTVIRRSDGLFAYQLAVTVDDLDMGVTDVVRGRDLLRSTALQLYIRALLQSDDSDGSTSLSVPSAASGPSTALSAVSIPPAAPIPSSVSVPPASPGVAACRQPISFTHLPLVDNAQGRRMAKREHSLDLGYLRANGVTPDQVIGYCAWMLGLQPSFDNRSAAGYAVPASATSTRAATPEPMSAAAALEAFRRYGWRPLRAHPSDRQVPDDPFALAATL